MSGMIGHQDARELLALAALEALTRQERLALETHASWCAECRSELAALRDAAGTISASLPRRPIAPERKERVRARLLARAAADHEGVTLTLPAASPLMPAVRMLAAAAVIAIVAGVATFAAVERVRAQRFAGELSRLREQESAMRAQLEEQKAFVDALTGPGVKVIDAAAASPRKPFARMFWDQPANRWTFVAYNVPAPAAGRTYQLWLVTKDQRKVSAGTFTPGAAGDAFVRATYALPRDQLAAIAVTEEPAGGSPQPTSTPFLVGVAGKTD